GGVTFSGTVNATTGVLFYAANGPVSVGSHSTLTITPQSSGTWAGMSIWIPPTNPLTAFQLASASAIISPTGTFSAPNVDVRLNGQSLSACRALIARSVTISSNSAYAHFGQPAALGAPSPTSGSVGSSVSITGSNYLPSTAI